MGVRCFPCENGPWRTSGLLARPLVSCLSSQALCALFLHIAGGLPLDASVLTQKPPFAGRGWCAQKDRRGLCGRVLRYRGRGRGLSPQSWHGYEGWSSGTFSFGLLRLEFASHAALWLAAQCQCRGVRHVTHCRHGATAATALAHVAATLAVCRQVQSRVVRRRHPSPQRQAPLPVFATTTS